MLFLHGPQGGAPDTSKFFRANIEEFVHYQLQVPDWSAGLNLFGVGPEPSFVCACGRTLPTYVVQADHAVPKVQLNWTILPRIDEIRLVGSTYQFPPEGIINTIETLKDAVFARRRYEIQGQDMLFYEAVVSGPMTRSNKGNVKFRTPVATVVKNDADNLRPLCGTCNASKGGR